MPLIERLNRDPKPPRRVESVAPDRADVCEANHEIGAMYHAESFLVATNGRQTYEITRRIQEAAANSGIERGLCSVFVHHTSASLIVCENADPDVRRDLETFMSRLVVDGDRAFIHTAEGPDDMPAHIRSILTTSSISIPVERGRCDLGTWQGVFLWEHRTHQHRRKVTVSVVG